MWPRLHMPLAVLGTLNSNKQTNKQTKTKTFNFSILSYGLTSTEMGSGSILLNREPKNGSQGTDKNEMRHSRII